MKRLVKFNRDGTNSLVLAECRELLGKRKAAAFNVVVSP